MGDQGLPNFNAMAASLHTTSAQQISLATQLERLHNIPALNDRIQIRQALAILETNFEARVSQIHRHLDAMYETYSFLDCITTDFVL